MTELETGVQTFTLLFARLGCFMMLLPGIGSTRTPLMVRLWIAVATCLALIPLLKPSLGPTDQTVSDNLLYIRIVHETIIGFALGFLARLSVLAVQFGGTLVVNSIGLAGIPGQAIEDADVLPPLASLASVTAVTLIFAADLHLQFIDALIASYANYPSNGELDGQAMIQMLISTIVDAHGMALRLAAPFIIYSITVNVAIGLANRFAPTISIYFISLGIVSIGGLAIFSLLAPDWLRVFLAFNVDVLERLRS